MKLSDLPLFMFMAYSVLYGALQSSDLWLFLVHSGYYMISSFVYWYLLGPHGGAWHCNWWGITDVIQLTGVVNRLGWEVNGEERGDSVNRLLAGVGGWHLDHLCDQTADGQPTWSSLLVILGVEHDSRRSSMTRRLLV